MNTINKNLKLLITGGAGFIGSNFIRYILKKYPGYQVTNLDKLTYAGNLENLRDVEKNINYHFVRGDIADTGIVNRVFKKGVDIVINFAAESHVDRSILDAAPFIDTNIRGTLVLLELARRYKVDRLIQVSTDEVYGSIDKGSFTEGSLLSPSSPYSASKAAADLLCLSYFKTHGIPVIITRCSNNFGPYQFPEKLIPLVITNALEGREMPVYGDGLNRRDWIFVEDHCKALDVVLQRGVAGRVYNIGAGNEKTNLDIIRLLLRELNQPESLIKFVKDRPGHDRRYAISNSLITKELGWKPEHNFRKAMKDTVRWYQEHEQWWRSIKSGAYQKYYEQMYGNRK